MKEKSNSFWSIQNISELALIGSPLPPYKYLINGFVEGDVPKKYPGESSECPIRVN